MHTTCFLSLDLNSLFVILAAFTISNVSSPYVCTHAVYEGDANVTETTTRKSFLIVGAVVGESEQTYLRIERSNTISPEP